MLDFTLALVGAGPLPELSMREGARQLVDRFSAELVPLACASEPHSGLEALASLQRDRNHPTLLCLSGDAAMAQGSSGSWMDALGAWRCPVLLLAEPNAAGLIPGMAPASVALCHSLNIPLLGLAQLGGSWDQAARRMDGLPWCGHLDTTDDDGTASDELARLIQQRWIRMNPEMNALAR
ncbi:hypothetical protein [Synechococcus sp. CC9311]|jgi:hypothetical protein|uniref:hypothetical protein n=1 Tax=Synechococcus sp. (strain CC9311) TaxID=64471 RepID=UPI0000DDACE8|nr:hypothetical protein [Synechococcus sp. CC9311]ABI46567.1 conserved hypothetical protein [Synechococcus sp. CC9311]